ARRVAAPDLAGAVALVAGGSRGLGLLIAEELVARGARVAIFARDAQELGAAVARLSEGGGEVLAIPADVRHREQVEAAVGRVVETFGGLDLLFNVAGVITVGPLATMSLDDFEDEMATHFWGPLHCVRAARPYLQRSHLARVANISSIGGKVSVPHLGPYSASKAALVGLSGAMRNELAAEGIRVTTVCPGLMRTGSHVRARFKGDRKAEFAWFAVSSSAPLVTIDARRAARKIVEATRQGRTELTFNWSAQALALLARAAPGPVSLAMRATSALLPDALAPVAERSTEPTEGWRHPSRWAPSLLTRRNDRAAKENLELTGEAAAYPVGGG
ncbi:MAG TPA: SDR family oxidoreductase, partial [Thermoanaerobaculia bacterium]|nr:SDR family oxidoreductase [Thermoanaerobaculia bacterium]